MITNQEYMFIEESNRIEGIHRLNTEAEMEEFERFMAQDDITLQDIKQFVSVYQPDAELRDRLGLNVYVGNHVPPAGDITIRTRLEDILNDANKAFDKQKTAYLIHQRYENLHPFTDGNGRSGRMLWLWMMREAPLGFLHTWYYQSLSNYRT
jgi:fido (protein-threonine AMPylation protein)